MHNAQNTAGDIEPFGLNNAGAYCPEQLVNEIKA